MLQIAFAALVSIPAILAAPAFGSIPSRGCGSYLSDTQIAASEAKFVALRGNPGANNTVAVEGSQGSSTKTSIPVVWYVDKLKLSFSPSKFHPSGMWFKLERVRLFQNIKGRFT